MEPSKGNAEQSMIMMVMINIKVTMIRGGGYVRQSNLNPRRAKYIPTHL